MSIRPKDRNKLPPSLAGLAKRAPGKPPELPADVGVPLDSERSIFIALVVGGLAVLLLVAIAFFMAFQHLDVAGANGSPSGSHGNGASPPSDAAQDMNGGGDDATSASTAPATVAPTPAPNRDEPNTPGEDSVSPLPDNPPQLTETRSDEGSTVESPDEAPPPLRKPNYQLNNPGATSPSGASAAQPSKPSAPGEFFGLKAEGMKVAYVVDKSGSMSGRPFELVKSELAIALTGLAKEQWFYVVLYDVHSWPPPVNAMASAIPKNTRPVLEWVNGTLAFGGTDPTLAIQEALSHEPDTLFLLSDGEFSESIIELLSRLPPDAVINTISMGRDSALLRRIAAEHNGAYRFVP